MSYPILVQPVLDKHCVECHTQKAGQPNVVDLAVGDVRLTLGGEPTFVLPMNVYPLSQAQKKRRRATPAERGRKQPKERPSAAESETSHPSDAPGEPRL